MPVARLQAAIALFALLSALGCGSQFEAEETEHCCQEFGSSLRVMSLNVAHGRGTWFSEAVLPNNVIKRNLERIAEVTSAEDIEVAGLQEAERRSTSGLNHVAMLADLSGFGWWVSGAHARVGAKKYGTAILGRDEVEQAEVAGFKTFGPGLKKGYSISTIDFDGGQVDVVSLHLDPLLGVRRKKQVRQVAEHLADRGRPVIVMGDFNAQWGEGKPATLLAEELGLLAFEPEADDMPTFKDRRLDWILVSEDTFDFEQYYVIPDEVSDHRAVVAEIVRR